MTEKQVENRLIRLIESLGGLCLKWGMFGLPDRICILPWGVWFVEVKRPSGVLSAIQKFRIKQFEKLGWKIWVVENYDQVDELIKIIKDADQR